MLWLMPVKSTLIKRIWVILVTDSTTKTKATAYQFIRFADQKLERGAQKRLNQEEIKYAAIISIFWSKKSRKRPLKQEREPAKVLK